MRARGLTAAVGLLLACPVALALPRDRTLRQLHHTAWTARDGAPSQVSALAQTVDGYLWIGTAHGLYRFDGVEFERFAPRDALLPSHNIYTLLATPDGGLWISFRPSGLGLLQDGRLTTWNQLGPQPPTPVHALARDHRGRIWVGTHDGLLLRSGSEWLPLGPEWNVPKERIKSLFVDRAGTLWVTTDTTFLFLPAGSGRFQATHARARDVARLTQSQDGTVWIATGESVARLDLSRPSMREPRGIAASGTDVLFDRDGALWLTSYGEHLARVPFPERGSRLERFDEDDGLSSNLASALLEDREGNIWVGTQNGLDRFRDACITPIDLRPQRKGLLLLARERGEVWVASATLPMLDRFRGDTSSQRPLGRVSSVVRSADGDIWWGALGGLYRQRDDKVEFFPTPRQFPLDYVWEVVGSDDGGVWARLGDVGLVHFKDGRWGRRPAPHGLLARGPSATFTDERGRTWFGYTESRIEVLDGGGVTRYGAAEGLDVGRIRVIRGRVSPEWVVGACNVLPWTQNTSVAN